MNEPTGRREVVVAVDVGGSTVKGLVVDAGGRSVAAAERPTPPRGHTAEAVSCVNAVITALTTAAELAGATVSAVGVTVPGDVDRDAGVARYSTNLGWRDLPVAAFTTAIDAALPVVLDHDVRSAAVAERTLGATRATEDACLVVIGTGIASVSLVHGQERYGARGLAGELGHIPIHPGGELCWCGQHGCLEAYASAGAISRRYAFATGRTGTARDIVARLATDDAAATVWAEATSALAAALVTVTMLDDPELIVIAGGLAEAGPTLLTPLIEQVTAGLSWREPPRVEISRLGARSGRYGIAVLAGRAAGWSEFEHWAQNATGGSG